MADYFPFLLSSKEGIFFIDNCSFNLSYNDPNALNRGDFFTANQLTEESSRLKLLTNKLFKMDNWLTIQEVIKEYEKRTKQLIIWQEKINRNPCFISALEKLINQRKKTYRLLKEEHRDATKNLTEDLSKKIDDLTPQVEKILKEYSKKPHKKNTDYKLISTALIYAEDTEVGIFSQDNPLLITFAYCAKYLNIPIKKTYILSEVENKKILSDDFLKINNVL